MMPQGLWKSETGSMSQALLESTNNNIVLTCLKVDKGGIMVREGSVFGGLFVWSIGRDCMVFMFRQQRGGF